jgi:hypothetical protein
MSLTRDWAAVVDCTIQLDVKKVMTTIQREETQPGLSRFNKVSSSKASSS